MDLTLVTQLPWTVIAQFLMKVFYLLIYLLWEAGGGRELGALILYFPTENKVNNTST
jgi:hypothetical protein